jgi:hypothetical protein
MGVLAGTRDGLIAPGVAALVVETGAGAWRCRISNTWD